MDANAIPAVNPSCARRNTGIGAIALGLAFNIPYALLAASFDYPQILRQPAGEVLSRFAEGGSELVLIWHAFALSAVALAPIAVALAITPGRLARHPALAIGAAICGCLSAFAQAFGLLRWVFVVPLLADGDASSVGLHAQSSFDQLNAYGGMAIGEHLGQLLLAMFLVQMGMLQWREDGRALGVTAMITAVLIAFGAWEGVMSRIGLPGGMHSMSTVVGFLALTAWLLATGGALARGATSRHPT